MKKAVLIIIAVIFVIGAAAIAAKAEGLMPEAVDGVIELSEDVSLTETLYLGENVTLKGNGFAIKAAEGFSGINLVVVRANVEMDDVILDGNGLARVINVESGSLKTAGAVIKNGRAGSGKSDWGAYGGGVNIEPGASYTAVNTVIKNNEALLESTNTAGGGGVCVFWDASFTMIGGEVSGNKANASGGGIWCSGTMTVKGSAVIRDNWARYCAGGVGFDGQSGLITENAMIVGNRCDSSYSGGVYTDSDGLTVSGNAVIKDNFIGSVEFDLNCRLADVKIEGRPVIGNAASGIDQYNACSSLWGIGSVRANGGTFPFDPSLRGDFVIDYEHYIVIDNHNGTWSIVPFVTVSYVDEGADLLTQKLAYGETAERPEDPEKTDARFLGWYKDAALTELYDFSEPVTEDLTLYAGWSYAAAAISLSADRDTIYAGGTVDEALVTVTPEPEDKEIGEFTVTVSGEGKVEVTVTEDGKLAVKAVSVGKVTVTVTTETGATDSVDIMVEPLLVMSNKSHDEPEPEPEPEPERDTEPDPERDAAPGHEAGETEEEEEIEEEETPLAETPEVEEVEETEETEEPEEPEEPEEVEEAGETEEEEEIELDEEETPLDDTPATDDETDTLLWTAFALLSLAGMAALMTAKKKEN